MNKEIGDVGGVKIFLTPEGYEELKKQKLIEENEILQDLQDRINKAIEYIKNTMKVDSEYPDYIKMEICEYQELLEILQGEEQC